VRNITLVRREAAAGVAVKGFAKTARRPDPLPTVVTAARGARGSPCGPRPPERWYAPPRHAVPRRTRAAGGEGSERACADAWHRHKACGEIRVAADARRHTPPDGRRHGTAVPRGVRGRPAAAWIDHPAFIARASRALPRRWPRGAAGAASVRPAGPGPARPATPSRRLPHRDAAGRAAYVAATGAPRRAAGACRRRRER